MQKSRLQEGRESDLKRMLVENNILAGHGKSELNVENRRRARSAACIRGELFMDYVHCKGAQDKERGKRISQFEENLADEMARRKAEALREEMDKRRICDGSEELRALKERLHAAKVNKERAMQLLQVEVGKANDRHHSMAMDEVMENERLEHLELEHKLNIEKTRQRERVKLINQQQIAANEAKKTGRSQRVSQREGAGRGVGLQDCPRGRDRAAGSRREEGRGQTNVATVHA